MPDLSKSLTATIKIKTSNAVRHFQNSYYQKYLWICACKKLNKIFCWPCILFSLEKNIWTKDGYSNLNNFYNAVNKHEKSQSHIASFLSFKEFGKVRIFNM